MNELEPRYLITGITGTMGTCLTRLILFREPRAKIVGISRDEQKQQAFPIKHPNLRLKLGNVADRRSLYRAATNASWGGYDAIFHLAAAKCAPFLETNPDEAVSTNITGTQNVLDLAAELNSHVCFASSDKAVKPINLYGFTKGVGERLVLAERDGPTESQHCVFRYGNILGSRGSFLPTLIKSLLDEQKAYVTHTEMTRFWMPVEVVANFIWTHRFNEGVNIPENMKAASVIRLIEVVASQLGIKQYEIETIGLRAGEKLHEDITENSNSGQANNQLTDGELRELVGGTMRSLGFFDLGRTAVPQSSQIH